VQQAQCSRDSKEALVIDQPGIQEAADVVVRPSCIEGLGVFAARPFRTGERIRRVNVVREITPDAPIREELGERIDHCSYPDGKVVLFGSPDRYLNHSCDPNAWEQYEGSASYLVARRGIAAGEEITCDYNINIADGTAWPCKCGATRCLGTAVGDFFRLPPDMQREYRPFLADWFVRRHPDWLAALDPEPRLEPRVAPAEEGHDAGSGATDDRTVGRP
jgi:hypothetical protein